jgi:hypothetical protein
MILVEGAACGRAAVGARRLRGGGRLGGCGNPEKLAAWEVVASDRSAIERVAELGSIDLPEDVRAAITELLAAVVDADH